MHYTQKHLHDLTYKIIGCAIEVHKELGPGLLESVYQKCFARELLLQHMDFISQTLVPISYKGMLMEADLRLDVLVENLILVELKVMDNWLPCTKRKY